MIERMLDKIKIWHIAAACAAIYICALSRGLSVGGDDADYIIMGRSFLEKGFFHQIFFLGILVRIYYFMLPVMLVPFLHWAPDNYLLMKLIPLVSGLLAVVLFNIFLKGVVGDRMRKMAVLLFALNPWMVEYSVLILTDVPYLFFSLACLVLFKGYTEKKKWYLFALSIAFGVCSVYTRPAGIILCVALLAFLAVKKRLKECAAMLAILAIMGAPIFAHMKEIAPSFTKQLLMKQDHFAFEKKEVGPVQLAYRMGRNLLVYTGNYLPDIIARALVSSIDPRSPDKSVNPVFFLKFLLGVFIGGLIAAGFFKTLQNGLAPYHLYSAIYLIFILMINVYVARYLLALLPFIFLFLVTGSAFAADKAKLFSPRVRIDKAFFAALIALSLIGTGQYIVSVRTGFMPAQMKSFIECNDWVKANVPPTAIVLSRKPYYTRLYAGRESVGYIFTDDPEKYLALIMDTRTEYVIVGDLGFYPGGMQYVLNTIKKYPGKFQLLYATRNKPEYFIYRVTR